MQEGSWALWRSVGSHCPQPPATLPVNKHVPPAGLGVTTQQRPDSLAVPTPQAWCPVHTWASKASCSVDKCPLTASKGHVFLQTSRDQVVVSQ